MWLAECAKQAGNWFTFVAAYAVIKELSVDGVALKTALFLICRRLPYLLHFPVTGLAADRLNRGSLLVAVCLVQGAVSFTLPIVEKRGDVWLLYPLILLQYSAQAFYDPARIAAIPTVIPKHLLCVAGTLDLSGFALMALFGAAMAGHTAAVYGTATCFRIEGFAFVTAAALMLPLARRAKSPAPPAAGGSGPASGAAGGPAPAPAGGPAPAPKPAAQASLGSSKGVGCTSHGAAEPAVHLHVPAVPEPAGAADLPSDTAAPKPGSAEGPGDLEAPKLQPAGDAGAGDQGGGCSGLLASRTSSIRSLSDSAVAVAGEPPPELQPLLAELNPPYRPPPAVLAPTVKDARLPYAVSDDGVDSHQPTNAADGGASASASGRHDEGLSGTGGRGHRWRGSGGDVGGGHGPGGGGHDSEDDGAAGGGSRKAPAGGCGGCGGCGALRFLARRRNWDVAALIWVKATGAMAWGAADVLNGRFAQMASMQTLGGADVTLGLVLVCVGLGSVMGPMAANGVTPGVARFWRVSIAVAFLLLASGYTLMAAARNILYVLPATVLRTTGSATIWVHSLAIMQHRLHEGIRGRLVALEFVLYTVSESGSTLFGGYALDTLGWSTRRLCLTLAGMGAAFAVAWSFNAWVLWDRPSTYEDEQREPLLPGRAGGAAAEDDDNVAGLEA